MANPFKNPSMLKQAGFGDMMSGAADSMSGLMPMMGGALAGAGAGAGLGGMVGGAAKPISAIIGAAMGAYAASKVDSAIDQNSAMSMNNAAGVDMNGQLGIQNALMNLDQQQLLGMPPMGMGPGMGQMDGSGMGMGQGMGMPPMGMGPGMGMGQGAGTAPQQSQVASGQSAMNTMQKRSAVTGVATDARAAVFAYFNQ